MTRGVNTSSDHSPDSVAGFQPTRFTNSLSTAVSAEANGSSVASAVTRTTSSALSNAARALPVAATLRAVGVEVGVATKMRLSCQASDKGTRCGTPVGDAVDTHTFAPVLSRWVAWEIRSCVVRGAMRDRIMPVPDDAFKVRISGWADAQGPSCERCPFRKTENGQRKTSCHPNSMPWERGRSLDQLIVTVWRRM